MRASRASSTRATGSAISNSTIRAASPRRTASMAPRSTGLRSEAATSRGSDIEPTNSVAARLARTILRLRSIRISGSGTLAITASVASRFAETAISRPRQARRNRNTAAQIAPAAGMKPRRRDAGGVVSVPVSRPRLSIALTRAPNDRAAGAAIAIAMPMTAQIPAKAAALPIASNARSPATTIRPGAANASATGRSALRLRPIAVRPACICRRLCRIVPYGAPSGLRAWLDQHGVHAVAGRQPVEQSELDPVAAILAHAAQAGRGEVVEMVGISKPAPFSARQASVQRRVVWHLDDGAPAWDQRAVQFAQNLPRV